MLDFHSFLWDFLKLFSTPLSPLLNRLLLIAITFPFRHLTQVTPRRVVYGIIGLNLTMALTVKFQFISGMLFEVHCAFQMSDRQARQVYFFVLHCIYTR